MEIWSALALAVAVVSVLVALWQGFISKQQLQLARDTEKRAEDTLTEIRKETGETRRVAQDIKANIDERITKILDSKLAGEQQSQAVSAQMSQMFTQKLFESMGASATKPDAS